MTCKDCISYDICSYNAYVQAEYSGKAFETYITIDNKLPCRFFKDKSRYIELPCKVGQTIFFYTCVCDKEGEEKFDTLEGEVISFSIQKEGLWAYCRYKCGLTYWHLVEQDFGETVFLTQEEAEKALAERSEDK